MKPLTFIHVVLPLIGLALSPECYSVKITRVINGNSRGPSGIIVFSEYDWELDPNQVVPVYTKTHDNEHGFAFVAHNPSETSAEVVMATIFSSDDNQKTCWEDFSNPYEGTPIFRQISYANRNTLKVQYTTEALLPDGGGWIDNVDTSKCKTPEIHIKKLGTQPPNAGDWNSTHHFLNASYLAADDLEPAEVNSKAGFIFTRENNETNPTESIMFGDAATGETTVLHVIQRESNKQDRQSYAHGKYGNCLMDDIDIVCEQFIWNKGQAMYLGHIELPKKVDWFSVHNLESAAMLIVTTDCPEGDCRTFKVQKLEEKDEVSKEHQIRGFSMHCEDPAANLKMHTTDVPHYSRICFNFVCTGKDFYDRRAFQYRRYCFNRDYFESK